MIRWVCNTGYRFHPKELQMVCTLHLGSYVSECEETILKMIAVLSSITWTDMFDPMDFPSVILESENTSLTYNDYISSMFKLAYSTII